MYTGIPSPFDRYIIESPYALIIYVIFSFLSILGIIKLFEMIFVKKREQNNNEGNQPNREKPRNVASVANGDGRK